MNQEDISKLSSLLNSLNPENLEDVPHIVRILNFVGDLAREEKNRTPIGNWGLSSVVGKFIKSSNPEIQKLVARAIGNLCFDEGNNRIIFFQHCNIGPYLIQFLDSSDEQVLKNSCGAVANLVVDYGIHTIFFKISFFSFFFQKILH